MRFFHLSDLHLGKHLHNYNLREDQIHILREVVDYAADIHPDCIVLAGDIYDKSIPSAEAVTLLDGFLTSLSEITPRIPILLISGNHDSGERLEYAREILGKQSIYIGGRVPSCEEEHLGHVTLQDAYGEVDFYLLPFLKPSQVRQLFPQEENLTYTRAVELLLAREEIDYRKRNVLLSHQFYTGNGQVPKTCDSEMLSVGGLDNVDISSVQNFDYVALGHIHRAQQVGLAHIRYGGTLLKYSVSEETHQKGITLVTIGEKGKPVQTEQLALHPLHDLRKMTGTLQQVLEAATRENREDYVSVTLTDEGELYKPREQLIHVYPNLLEVHLDNARVRSRLSDMGEEITLRSPLEMFGNFYREVHGSELPSQAMEIMQQLMEEIGGGEQ